ncbi:uncharacterized protein LOC116614255 isoform X2 [Nematostella vectensis]|uniref:uncharacterized protein LOC116614255 isoform X2 n=1 Tax=Nematostella vectensis TaxID=45351 RepID=UPI002076DA69|nr:uncharacterized protein LOC116614255 isoform X2 [Nematostella vectensis]
MILVIAWFCCIFTLAASPGSAQSPTPGPIIIDVKSGSDVILSCDTGGNSFDLINWSLNNSKSPFFIKFMNFKPYVAAKYARRLHMVNSSAILVSSVTGQDAGRYRCKTMATSTGDTAGLFKLGTPIELRIQGSTSSVPSQSKKVTEGKLTVLDCQTDTSLPSSNVLFTWTKDGRDVTSSQNPRISVLVSGSLFIRGIMRSDSGVYRCTAKTFDQTGSGIVNYPGSDIFLDVQFPPSIIVISSVVTVGENTDARLPCVSEGNPATEVTKWTRVGGELGPPDKFVVLERGSLLIRKVKRSDMGTYVCTPSNYIGAGKPGTTNLVVQVVPTFTEVPSSVVSVRVGEEIRFKCSAVSETVPSVSWRRVGKAFSNRTQTSKGLLTILGVQTVDHGEYECVAETDKGKAVHTTTLNVISVPSRPTITAVSIEYTTARIVWTAGYDGGFAQRFRVWYRRSKDSDSQWKKTPQLPLGTLSHEIPGLVENTEYYFAVRAINKEGPGDFSQIMSQKGSGSPTVITNKPQEPLPPTDVIVNITSDGYVLSWKHDPVPGRPSVKAFVVQYRQQNASSEWIEADGSIPSDTRTYTLKAKHLSPNTDYEFRIFAYGNTRSRPAYVSNTYHIAAPVVAKRMTNDDVIPIVAGVLGALAFLVLLGLVCFCCLQCHAKKKGTENSKSKKVHFVLPDGSTHAYEGESEDDFCDSEIKLMPEAVRFTPDITTEEKRSKRSPITKEDSMLLLTNVPYDEPFGGQMLRHKDLIQESPYQSPVHSPKDKVLFFGEPSGWYDCTLSRPASREVRDSYDQFCQSPADAGSRDSLDRASRKRALYEHKGSKIHLVKKFDSNSSLQFEKPPARESRFSAIAEEVDLTDVSLIGSHKRPHHHWSTPEVFRGSRVDDSNNNKESHNSDSESLDSFSRRRRRRARPESYHEGAVSQQPELVPISEQDSNPSFKCLCEDSTDEKDAAKEDNRSSYLHLERNDSQKSSFVDQLKGWEEEAIGQPYQRHERTKAGYCNVSDSDNSVSPAHSLVSLSDSDVDAEIARKLHEGGESRPLSYSGEPDKSHLYRAVSYLKSVDTGSASDTSEMDDKNVNTLDRDRRQSRLSAQHNKDKEQEAVTTLKDIKCTDSLDQLKVCDPFYRAGSRPARTPSNASSGVFSVQVSSSETNSIESSPHQSRRRSARSSGTSSSGFDTASSRGSYSSEGFRTIDPARAHALRNTTAGRFPHLEEPYEWDREGTGSEFESGSDTGGFSFKPNMIANMRHLLDLQRRLGIDLDSASSSESLPDKEKYEKMAATDALEFSPSLSPTKYHVDRYSLEEKDKRCSKLMEEYKANRRVEDEKLNGSIIYQSWDL